MSGWSKLKVFVAVSLVAGLIKHQFEKRKKNARLIWCHEDERMSRIVSSSRFLTRLSYVPPFWVFNGWINLGLFMLKQKLWKAISAVSLKRQELTTRDNGTISIEWMDDPVTRSLPDDAPVLCVLHTITGSGDNSWDFLRDVPKYGWRACVFVRRGHGDNTLKNSTFNIMGDVEDTKLQVSEVQKKYPHAFLGMVGISAGSGLLITYLGKESKSSPIKAAASLCPAYDISKAFQGLADKYPVVNQVITTSMKTTWILGNEAKLRAQCEKSLDACLNASSIHEFWEASYKFAGYDSLDDFFEHNNPMNFYHGIDCPTLVLNALDDPVCLKENIRVDLAENTPNIALALTETGSHIAFVDGLLGESQWMTKLCMDFMHHALNDHVSLKKGDVTKL